MKKHYKEDLDYIHDTGHSEFALQSAPVVEETRLALPPHSSGADSKRRLHL
jgi:hypothetical protein